MANPSVITGFTPKRYFNGAPTQLQVQQYVFDSGDSTATFIGDLVTSAGNQTQVTVAGSASAGLYLPRIKQSAASDAAIVGVLIGCEVNTANLSTTGGPLWRLASTQRVGFVVDDPMVVYEAQSNGATGITAAKVTYNYHISVGTGSVTTGYSAMVVDDSQSATTNTYEIRMLRLVPSVDNTLGQYNKVEVMLNNCFWKAGIAGV